MINEIPDDIMQAAENVYDAMQTVAESWRGTVCAGNDIEYIARAIIAERENCARIFERYVERSSADADEREWAAKTFGRLRVKEECERADTAEAELSSIRAENERLREALKPFAAVNQKHVRTGIWHHHDEIAEQILSADDFSRARAALKGGE